MSMNRAGTSRTTCAIAVGAFVFLTDLVPARADADLEPTGIKEASHQLEVEITGPLAVVTSTQTVLNPGKEASELVYTFELPDNAAVTDLRVSLPGGRVAKGVVVDAEAATHATPGAEALEAEGAAPDAGLLRIVQRDRDRDPLSPGKAIYELRAYPVPAGGSTRIEVSWLAPLRLDDGRLSLRIPSRGSAGNLVTEKVSLSLKTTRAVRGYRQLFAGDRLLAARATGKRYTMLAPRSGDLVIEAVPELAGSGAPDLAFATVPLGKRHGVIAVKAWAPRPTGRSELDHDRVMLVVDRSASVGKDGAAAAAKLASALLDEVPPEARVELVTYDRTASRAFGRWRLNDAKLRSEIAAAVRAPHAYPNGSDLGAALDLVRKAVEREEDGRGRGSTLVAVFSDGMAPLHLTGDRAIDRIGADVITRGQVLGVTLVPDAAPTPDTSAGPLGALAARTGGRSIAVRYGQVAAGAGARDLAAELSRPPPLEQLNVDAGKTAIHRLDLPPRLEAGRGFLSVGYYRGRAPAKLAFTGRVRGKKHRLSARRESSLGTPALPLALIEVPHDGWVPALVRESDSYDFSVEDLTKARAEYLEAARKAGVVTPRTALVALDPGDAFARDRLALTRKWGGKVFVRMPAPDEIGTGGGFPDFVQRTGATPMVGGSGGRPTGTLDRAIIARLIDHYVVPRARACYEKQLKRNPDLSGGLVLYLELARGEVQWAEVQRSTFPSRTVEACIADSGYTIRVPRVAQGDDAEAISVVTYPLSFRRSKDGTRVRSGGAPPPVKVDPDAPL